MKIRNKITAILMLVTIIISSFSLITSASANGLTFSDVTEQTLYFEDIIKVKELGGIVGSGNKEFRPDDRIIFAEAVTIAERLFGDVENLPDWAWWFNQSNKLKSWKNKKNIDTSLVSFNYSEITSKEAAAHIIMQMNNDQCVLREASYKRKSYYTFLVRGYKDIKDVEYASSGLTRAEFCHMIIWYMENENGDWPNIETKINIQNDANTNNMNFMAYQVSVELLKVPVEIRTAFSNYGYNVILFTNENWKNFTKRYEGGSDLYTYDTYINAAGIYSYDENIYLREGNPDSIIHEMGHFVGHHSDRMHKNSDLLMNNVEEVKGLRQIQGWDYCTTNKYEYFAEAFDAYINHPEKLQELAPLTYDMVEEAIASVIN